MSHDEEQLVAKLNLAKEWTASAEKTFTHSSLQPSGDFPRIFVYIFVTFTYKIFPGFRKISLRFS